MREGYAEFRAGTVSLLMMCVNDTRNGLSYEKLRKAGENTDKMIISLTDERASLVRRRNVVTEDSANKKAKRLNLRIEPLGMFLHWVQGRKVPSRCCAIVYRAQRWLGEGLWWM